MAILVDKNKKVIVQGITGREGAVRTKLMIDYGTKVIGGCTPGKGGQEVYGLPVFDTVKEACEKLGKIDVSVVFVPAPRVKEAAIEAMEAGIPLVALIADRVPLYDVLEICEVADEREAKFIGPNTVGVMSPEKAVIGMMGGNAQTAKSWFYSGNVGIVSRSGGLSASTGYYLCQAGVGISTICHVGGDSVVGLTIPEVVRLFEKDEETHLIVIIGEIGGLQEEQVAELVENGEIKKPIVAYIGGKSAQSGTRYSHAGAIIEGERGTWQSKVEKLRAVGVEVVEKFNQIPEKVKEVLSK
ncbi:MAG: succinate--CoA ligase subunit alpha [Acidobacteria bacterium]|jgi:succinyl-CoA synthetase alpha subunit|nr:MAG: succinate--CoA ligase subunit alpha [Acidobacteriota bacterium]GIU81367.1 MAG: succinyl-CoA synthetase subunit alpha [Pyrinomonadaceae bacterium]